jgi:hypothetical protein
MFKKSLSDAGVRQDVSQPLLQCFHRSRQPQRVVVAHFQHIAVGKLVLLVGEIP